MEFFDMRLSLLAAGAAAVSSERVRKTMGRGLGYAAAGAMSVARPVAGPLMEAGRDIVDEARTVTNGSTSSRSRSPRSTTGSS